MDGRLVALLPTKLLLTDNDLYDYDTNLKINPPFRTQEDLDYICGIVSIIKL